MKKLFLIGFKDLKLVFRDKAALTFMLLAPFLLTLGLGFVTGAYRQQRLKRHQPDKGHHCEPG